MGAIAIAPFAKRLTTVLAGCCLLLGIYTSISLSLARLAEQSFGEERLPDHAEHLAAVIFYVSTEPFRSARLKRGVELVRSGRVEKLLFVGGYRPNRSYVGAQREAAKAALEIGRGGVAFADLRSYDTLSNIEAACQLRNDHAPGFGLILVSEPLHLNRIWANRDLFACLDERSLGWSPTLVQASFSEWLIGANKDLAARVLATVLGREFYRAIVRDWRFLGQ
jgi:hypothetical protein